MHVLTTQGISTITVPDELPALLRDFTKDVIRAQPKDLVHYAAVYFSALAGIGWPPAGAPAAAAYQPSKQSSSDAVTPIVRTFGELAHDLLPARLRLDDGGAAADCEQTEGLKVPLTATSEPAAAPPDIAPSAAWGVSGSGGEVVGSMPPPSQLYASRRTSDRQEPAFGSNTITAESVPEQAADGAAEAAFSGLGQGLSAAGQDPAAGDGSSGSTTARHGRDAALVAMAERLFAEADDDGSGALDRKEFRNVIRSMELGLSTAQVRALMAEADENEDGFVDWREFLPAFLPLLRSLQAAKQVAAEQEAGARSRAEAMLQADMPQEALEALMRDIFRSADTDGSGALSRAEFKVCLRSDTAAGLKLSRQDINTLLTEVDADGNGLVDYEEFIPVAYNILVERLKDSLLAAAGATE